MTTNENTQAEQDETLSITATFTSYPEISEDGETGTMTLRQVALGLTPLILIEPDETADEPTFNISLSEIPMDVAAAILSSLGQQLGNHLAAADEHAAGDEAVPE